jgi:hypothetical protein
MAQRILVLVLFTATRFSLKRCPERRPQALMTVDESSLHFFEGKATRACSMSFSRVAAELLIIGREQRLDLCLTLSEPPKRRSVKRDSFSRRSDARYDASIPTHFSFWFFSD